MPACSDASIRASRRASDIDGNAYICLLDVGVLPRYATPRYRPPSRFPSTYRDLALVVEARRERREPLEESIAAGRRRRSAPA